MNEVFREAVKHGPDCPAVEQLLDAPGMFTAHLEHCSACRTEVALFRRFEDGPETAEERAAARTIVSQLKRGTPKESTQSWRRFFQPSWLGAAAMAAAAVIFAVHLSSNGPSRSVTPVTDAAERMRSQSVRITSSYGELERMPQTVQWAPVEGTVAYDVNLTEVDGTDIIHKKVTGPSFPIPDPTYRLVNSGKTIQLKVAALDLSGNEIANSGLITFHVRQK